MIRRLLCAVGVALLVAVPAEARTNITVDATLVQGGVVFVEFTVTTAGFFDIWTTSRQGVDGATPFDPEMYLFAGPVANLGELLRLGDDGCQYYLAQCGPTATPFFNAMFNELDLYTGIYTIAVGASWLDEEEARTGNNQYPGDQWAGDFSIRISSEREFIYGTRVSGEAILNTANTAAVPEPGSLVLLGTGLVAAVIVRRRRR